MLSAQKLKIDALSKEMVPGSRVSQDGRGSGEGRNDWCEVQGEAESKTMMILAVQLANKGEKWPPTKCWREFCKPGKITSQQYNWCKKPFFFFFYFTFYFIKGFPGGTVVKNLPVNTRVARVMASIPGWERSPVRGNGNPLQYSCLENPIDRGAWWAIVHRVTKSQTQPSNWAYTHIIQSDARQLKKMEITNQFCSWRAFFFFF